MNPLLFIITVVSLFIDEMIAPDKYLNQYLLDFKKKWYFQRYGSFVYQLTNKK